MLSKKTQNLLYKQYSKNALSGNPRKSIIISGARYTPDWDVANCNWTGGWFYSPATKEC